MLIESPEIHQLSLSKAAGRVGVLNGGLPAWKAQGLPLDEQAVPEAEAQKAVNAAGAQSASSPGYQAALQVCCGLRACCMTHVG